MPREIWTNAREGWIETYTGRRFHLRGDDPDEMVPEDIAHALALIVRYNGHIRSTFLWYSVAEHCCHLTDFAAQQGATPRELLTVLHHEDPEAYIGDLARPVKQMLPDFRALDTKLGERAAKRFGLLLPAPPWLKEHDARIIVDERRQVMGRTKNTWTGDHLEPLGITIEFWDPPTAKREWLTRHDRLTAQCIRQS